MGCAYVYGKDGSTLEYSMQVRHGTHQFWAKSTVRGTVRKICESTGTLFKMCVPNVLLYHTKQCILGV